MSIFDGAIFDSAIFDTGAAASSVTVSGRRASSSSWAYKTLSQIREEEKQAEEARLKREAAEAARKAKEAAKRAKEAAEAEQARMLFMQQALAEQARIEAQIRLMQFLAEQDEEDAEALLLAA